MSISSEQMRSTKSRPYHMRRRAEQVNQTRERITEAAARLHTTVGPAHSSIAAIAEEAGVTRLTVYRHFADLDALFEACRAHWSAKWRYTVRRVTPASSAMAAIDEWAGPTVVWRRAAASVMRSRVWLTCSARRRMW